MHYHYHGHHGDCVCVRAHACTYIIVTMVCVCSDMVLRELGLPSCTPCITSSFITSAYHLLTVQHG